MLGWQAFCLDENNLYDLAEKTAKKVIQSSIFIVIFLKNVSSELYFAASVNVVTQKLFQRKNTIDTNMLYMCVIFTLSRLFKCNSD